MDNDNDHTTFTEDYAMRRFCLLFDRTLRYVAASVSAFVGIGMLTYDVYLEGLLSIPIFTCSYFTAVDTASIHKRTTWFSKPWVMYGASACVCVTTLFALYLYTSYHPVAGVLLGLCAVYTYYRYPTHLNLTHTYRTLVRAVCRVR